MDTLIKWSSRRRIERLKRVTTFDIPTITAIILKPKELKVTAKNMKSLSQESNPNISKPKKGKKYSLRMTNFDDYNIRYDTD